MNLRPSRALWRRREVSRYRRWQAAKSKADRERYYKLYIEAHNQRVHRDRQLALVRKKRGSGVPLSAVRLVTKFEGFSSKPYRDAVGVWTIGYGETLGVGPHTKPISRARALLQLRTRLNRDFLPAVRAADTHHKLTAKQEGGFTSFVYNVGTGGVGPSTTVGRRLRSGSVRAAADAILAWDKAGGRRLRGLTLRRQAERAYIL